MDNEFGAIEDDNAVCANCGQGYDSDVRDNCPHCGYEYRYEKCTPSEG
jgi:predicted amidophosphoribosyltransferase